eukprot:TRINITY_DN11209_c0_g1_i1.p1 TRINITY_DN11209_c0_g1~~TRINITY_DN11209_c0_g1_i1.p1  ORF type:complete len:493 (-),score=123.45 TRINITY_DN11209_c0_g1_i1:22-1500(-)
MELGKELNYLGGIEKALLSATTIAFLAGVGYFFGPRYEKKEEKLSDSEKMELEKHWQMMLQKAAVAQQNHNIQESFEMCARALKVASLVFGNHHQNFAVSLLKFAPIFSMISRNDDAHIMIKDATSIFEEILIENPSEESYRHLISANVMLSEVKKALGDFLGVADVYEYIIELEKQYMEEFEDETKTQYVIYLFQSHISFMRAGRYSRAKEVLEEMVQYKLEQLSFIVIIFEKMQLLHFHKQTLDEFITFLTQYLQDISDSLLKQNWDDFLELYLMVSDSYKELGQYEKSITFLQITSNKAQSLGLSSIDSRINYALAAVCWNHGSKEEARAHLNSIYDPDIVSAITQRNLSDLFKVVSTEVVNNVYHLKVEFLDASLNVEEGDYFDADLVVPKLKEQNYLECHFVHTDIEGSVPVWSKVITEQDLTESKEIKIRSELAEPTLIEDEIVEIILYTYENETKQVQLDELHHLALVTTQEVEIELPSNIVEVE